MAIKKFLDSSGLNYLWNKIVALVPTNLKNGSRTGSVRNIYSATEDSNYTIGSYAYAEGDGCYAEGDHSHAEGSTCHATGHFSHAQNWGTNASKDAQTVMGTFNAIDSSTDTSHPSHDARYGNWALVLGNGTGNATANRSNAMTVGWNGFMRLYNGIALRNSDILQTETSRSTASTRTIYLEDQNGATVGAIQFRAETNGVKRTQFYAQRVINGTTKYNIISTAIDNDGNQTYSVSNQANFRSAIAAQESLTSGTNIKTINSKSLLGSGNLSTSDLGASPSTHNHDTTYLKLSGGNITGDVTLNNSVRLFGKSTSGSSYNLTAMNSSNTITIGYTSYSNNVSGYDTNVYGYNVHLYVRGNLYKNSSTTISTSDERLKTDFSSLDKFEDMFMSLKPVEYKWINKDNKKHFGMVAQDVEKAMAGSDIDQYDYSLITEMPGDENDETVYKGLAYEEFIPLCIHMIQKQQKEIEELKRIVNLEGN